MFLLCTDLNSVPRQVHIAFGAVMVCAVRTDLDHLPGDKRA